MNKKDKIEIKLLKKILKDTKNKPYGFIRDYLQVSISLTKHKAKH